MVLQAPERWILDDASAPAWRGRQGGSPSPAAAVVAAPVITWPVALEAHDGRRISLGPALGEGGDDVEALLARLIGPRPAIEATNLAALATSTPLGPEALPVDVVTVAEGVSAAGEVDSRWLAALDARRSTPRQALIDAGREVELEAGLHVTMLLATERLSPSEDGGLDERIASGAQLWLLGGAVAWTLLAATANPFRPWAELVTAGVWPIGPSRGRLVVAAMEGG